MTAAIENSGHFKIHGIVPVIPTPFRDNEEIAWESLPGLIRFAAAAGACAICLPAYASEFYKLSDEERLRLVREAVASAGATLPVIAQVNAPSLRQAVSMARAAEDCGAAAIATAVPRLFPVPESDLDDYFDRFLAQVRLPVIIQDFNPGGASVSVGFVQRLHRLHPHFRYLKLEEPMMAGKIMAVREATGGGVEVLEGWGGMYILDLAPAEIAGVVPGLGPVDVLDRIFRLARAGRLHQASPIFEAVLPQIVYSLQSLEMYHHAEKRLLAARGVLRETTVRRPRLTLSRHEEQHIEFINLRFLALLDQLHLPRNPAA